MYFKLFLAIFTLLYGRVDMKITDKDLILKQWNFDGDDWIVLVEEPSFEDEKYTITKCSIIDNLNEYIVQCDITTLSYNVYDSAWYNKLCSIQTSVQQNNGFLNDFRLKSMGNDNKVISISTYTDDATKKFDRVEMNCVNMNGCKLWPSNKVINIKNSQHDIIPYENTFDYVIKTGQSFDNRIYFKMMMNDDGQSLDNAYISYEYEAPRNYNSFNVYSISNRNPSKGYFFVYDFGDIVKVFSVNSKGEVKFGKNIFQQYSTLHTYRDVKSIQSNDGMILVCGHVLVNQNVNVTCTMLGESLNVMYNRSYTTADSEKIVANYIVKSKDIILATVNSKVDNATFLFDKITVNGTKERLFELKETKCDIGQAVQFGKVYEVTNDICFSTYCNSNLAKRKWNVRCFNKNLLLTEQHPKNEIAESVHIIYVTSNTLIFAIVGFQITLYVILYIIPSLQKLMRKDAESHAEVDQNQVKYVLK